MEVIKDSTANPSTVEGEISTIVYEKEPETVKEPAKIPEFVPKLDVCFMLDCTGSMQSYIDRAKNKIKDIIEEVKQQYPESEIQVGIVGYRDINDTKRFEVLPFTANIQGARDFLDAIRADGGADCPEDINGGFQQALGEKMEWTGQAKMIVHIADAPCHGKTFHSTGDDFPEGYKDDMAWDVIFKKIVEQHIDYLFLSINAGVTDKMFEKFKEIADSQGASANGVLFKQEPISNADKPKTAAAPATSLFAPVSAPTSLFSSAPAAAIPKKKRAPRKEKDTAATKSSRKGRTASRSESKKPSKSKTPSRKKRATPEEEEEDEKDEEVRGKDDEEDESWVMPRYWTRSKAKEWETRKEEEKTTITTKKSRGRKASKKRDTSEEKETDADSSYWVIPHFPDTSEVLSTKKKATTKKHTGTRKSSASKERERKEKRENKKDEKSTERKRSKSKAERVVEKSTKRAFISPKKNSKKVVSKPPVVSAPPVPTYGMSALDEQEYFAKLLSKEMVESLHRKKNKLGFL